MSMPSNVLDRKKFAAEFYAVDSQLTPLERDRLAKSFSRVSTAAGIGSLVITVIGVAGPGYLSRRGHLPFLPNPPRMVQGILGALGTFFGGAIVAGALKPRELEKLEDAPYAQKAFELLYPFGPSLAANYYRKTSRHPETAFPDPSQIDVEQTFPAALVRAPTTRPQEAGSSSPTTRWDDLRRKAQGPPTAWDKIRQDKQSPAESPEQPQATVIREPTPTDDFSESEKKWS